MKPTFLAAALLVLAGLAEAQSWRMDPSASRLGFIATWEGDPFETLFRRFTAEVTFNPEQPENASIVVRVDVSSVDSASPDRDEGMGDPAWLAYGEYPEAVYRTTAVRRAGDDAYIAEGLLSLKGVTRPVEVRLGWTREDNQARLEARAEVLRTDFGVGEGEWADTDEIGFKVQVFGELLLQPLEGG